MKLLEQKQRKLQRVASEIQRLSQGNPQQQRKCARLKEDHKKLMQEIQKLRESKDEKIPDKLRKQKEESGQHDESEKGKRRKLEKQYEQQSKALDVPEETEEIRERADDPNENMSSLKTDENIYLDEPYREVKPIQKDQYGVYEQVINMKIIEERMLKRQKIESEVKDALSVEIASLCELEATIGNMIKQGASPVIRKFEKELQLIRKKSSKDTNMLKTKVVKLEKRINKSDKMREICATAISEMNLTSKRMLFDLMGLVVNILRNVLYIVAWIRDSLVYYTDSK